MIRHVLGPNPLGLVDKGPLFRLREQLPLGAEPLGDLRVVHLGVLLRWKSQLIKIYGLGNHVDLTKVSRLLVRGFFFLEIF